MSRTTRSVLLLGSSWFTAIQELGLKLESRKGPVEILVIDQRAPTAN